MSAVAAVFIPEDSRDPLYLISVETSDGGLASLYEHLEGEPEEVEFPGRQDVVAFVWSEASAHDRPRNLRATRLLRHALAPGGWIAGDCLIAGQQDDTGIAELPSGAQLANIEAALTILEGEESA